MSPLIFLLKGRSLKKEAAVIVCIVTFLVIMPIVSLLIITNVGVLVSSAISIYDGPLQPGDDYAFGNCTYWVAMRRAQINQPIPNNWGNAATWSVNAQHAGYVVDHNPSYGAIMQISNVDQGLGHVAFVESVDPDGTWHISEMNVVGFDEVDTKAMPASAALQYDFIH
jgi:surface antigen